MDSSLSTLGFVIFGITLSIYAVTVESQPQNASSSTPSSLLRISPPPPRLPPSRRTLRNAPSSVVPPPSHPPHHIPYSRSLLSLPPSTTPRYPPSSSTSTSPSPSPSPSPHWVHLMPPSQPPHNGHTKGKKSLPIPIPHGYIRPLPPPAYQMNRGKKIGLLFAGIAGIMQIGVVGFLVFKRRQLLKTKDTFETSA